VRKDQAVGASNREIVNLFTASFFLVFNQRARAICCRTPLVADRSLLVGANALPTGYHDMASRMLAIANALVLPAIDIPL
jgi:hypothetical protein